MGVEAWSAKGYFKDESRIYHVVRKASLLPFNRKRDIYLEVGHAQLYKCDPNLRPESYISNWNGQIPQDEKLTLSRTAGEILAAYGRACAIVFPMVGAGRPRIPGF